MLKEFLKAFVSCKRRRRTKAEPEEIESISEVESQSSSIHETLKPMMAIHDLPEDIMFKVFSYLTPEEISEVEKIDRRFQSLVQKGVRYHKAWKDVELSLETYLQGKITIAQREVTYQVFFSDSSEAIAVRAINTQGGIVDKSAQKKFAHLMCNVLNMEIDNNIASSRCAQVTDKIYDLLTYLLINHRPVKLNLNKCDSRVVEKVMEIITNNDAYLGLLVINIVLNMNRWDPDHSKMINLLQCSYRITMSSMIDTDFVMYFISEWISGRVRITNLLCYGVNGSAAHFFRLLSEKYKCIPADYFPMTKCCRVVIERPSDHAYLVIFVCNDRIGVIGIELAGQDNIEHKKEVFKDRNSCIKHQSCPCARQ